MHPLQGGYFRRKLRRHRRSSLPRESPLVFYSRRLGSRRDPRQARRLLSPSPPHPSPRRARCLALQRPGTVAGSTARFGHRAAKRKRLLACGLAKPQIRSLLRLEKGASAHVAGNRSTEAYDLRVTSGQNLAKFNHKRCGAGGGSWSSHS
jgi:hypothetical protein